jgi:hypothetical protein
LTFVGSFPVSHQDKRCPEVRMGSGDRDGF